MAEQKEPIEPWINEESSQYGQEASEKAARDGPAKQLALVAAQEEKHMTTESISTLVPSTNAGRYALDDPVSGPDVTSGQPLAVLLGGHWSEGRVEHTSNLYANERSGQVERGYYFIAADDGTICGLCTGMQVRRC